MNEQILDKIKKSEIYLYGISEKTKEIYLKYKDILNIKACVTNYTEMQKKNLLDEYGVPTILIEDFNYTGKEYLIACEEQLYDEYHVCFMKVVEETVKYYHIKEYNHYVSYKVLDFLLNNKKMVLLQGSLLCQQIYEKLKCQESMKDMELVYYDEDIILNPYADDFIEYLHMAKFADIYIYSVSDKEKYNTKVLSAAKLKEGCIRIGVSDYCNNMLYPQIDKGREHYSTYLLRTRKRVKENYGRFFLAREDSNIVEQVLEGVDEDEIVSKICSEDFYSKEDLKKHYEKNIQKLKAADSKSDIMLSEYISKNMGKIVPNCNLDEYNDEIVNYVCSKIMQRIGRTFSVNVSGKSAYGTELIIYPSVAHYFGMNELIKNKEYRVYTYTSSTTMRLEEYIRYYIKCVKQVINLFELTKISEFKNNKLAQILQRKFVYYPKLSCIDDVGDHCTYYNLGDCSYRICTELMNRNITHEKVLAVLPMRSLRGEVFWGAELSNNCFVTTDETDLTIIKSIIDEVKPKAIITSEKLYNKIVKIAGNSQVIELTNCLSVAAKYDEILNQILSYGDDFPIYIKAEPNSDGMIVQNCVYYDELLNGTVTVSECIL